MNKMRYSKELRIYTRELEIIPNEYNKCLQVVFDGENHIFIDGDSFCPEKMRAFIVPNDVLDLNVQDIYWECIGCKSWYTSEQIVELWKKRLTD